jgi:hypothetical protein
LVTRYQAGKNGGGNKGGFKKQVCQKTDGAAEQQHANNAVDIKAIHIMTFKVQIWNGFDF